ncbi:MAG: phosphatase [Planctomycetota bacterium]|jgi:putative hydrolase|nr:phosphatase [Planctomycetota bacterium]
MLTAIQVDTHTHTVLSGHAWSTLQENAAAARERDLFGLCLTEHGPRMPGGGTDIIPAAQNMLPKTVNGIRVYKGTEANIVDFNGLLDIGSKFLSRTEFAIASLHDICMQPGDAVQNTGALLAAINTDRIDMLGHLDDPKVPCELDTLVTETNRLGKLVEINNNSLAVRRNSEPNVVTLAKLCMRLQAPVCVSSDAHFATMVGAVDNALALLNRLGFPEELVINRNFDIFDAYINRKAPPGKYSVRIESASVSDIAAKISARGGA